MLRRLFALVLAGLMLCASAAAGEYFTIDVDALDMGSLNSDDYVARMLSASTQAVRVVKSVSQSTELAVSVRLTLTRMDTRTVVYDRDYGLHSGTFDSGVIYLPYGGERTMPYLVTLYAGDYVYALPFMQLQPRLTGNSACTAGLRLKDVGIASDWQMGTMVDLSALEGSTHTVDLVASNHYVVGQAHIRVQGGQVRVDLSFAPEANVVLESAAVYVITDCRRFLDGSRGMAYAPGEWVDASGAQTAMIYVPLQLGYDPSGLPGFAYGYGVDAQRRLWQNNLGQTEKAFEDSGAAESGTGTAESGTGIAESGTGTAGWTDGWSEGGGWDDGWNGTADGWQ